MVILTVLLLLLAAALPFIVVIGLGIYAVHQFNQIKPWEEDVFDYDPDKDKE